MKRSPVPFLRARLAALFLLSLAAVYGVGMALAPARMHRPVQLAWPPIALGVATLGGAALMDRFYMIVDRAGRSRLQLLAWIGYGALLLLVGLGILSGEKGQDAVRTGAGVMRMVQVAFLLFAGLGRGHIGTLMNAFAMTCISMLGGGPAAAVTVSAHAGLVVFFLVADHHARLLTDYPVDVLPASAPVLRRAAVLGAVLVGGLVLFFWFNPCQPYAPLVTRGGVRGVVPPEQAWALVADLVGLTIAAGLAFWLVLWMGGGRGRDVEEVSSQKVAARRGSAPRPSPIPPPDVPDPRGWRARIVKVYVRLVDQLSRLGVPRGQAQTPLEFSRALEPKGAAALLTELFHRARYGDQDLQEADFNAASSTSTEVLDHFRGRKA